MPEKMWVRLQTKPVHEIFVDTYRWILRKAFEIEESGSAVIMKMYPCEESKERKKILHNLLRDMEHHRIMISDLSKDLGGEEPSRLSEIRDYDFEEMFIDQKLNILRKIEESSRDFYRAF